MSNSYSLTKDYRVSACRLLVSPCRGGSSCLPGGGGVDPMSDPGFSKKSRRFTVLLFLLLPPPFSLGRPKGGGVGGKQPNPPFISAPALSTCTDVGEHCHLLVGHCSDIVRMIMIMMIMMRTMMQFRKFTERDPSEKAIMGPILYNHPLPPPPMFALPWVCL